MGKQQYGAIEPAKPDLEPRSLLIIPHNDKPLVISLFGPNLYKNNLQEMFKDFSCPPRYQKISFREPLTAESISAIAYEFKTRAKPEILDHRWLQLGRIVKTQEGVYANPPRDKNGKSITKETELKSLLDNSKKVGEIYLCENGFGFAPYESFNTGIQDSKTFSQGGLARLLEYTQEQSAPNFQKISSKENYKLGVNIWGFKPLEKPSLKVVSLLSDRCAGGYRLSVDGSWYYDNGCAFGVLK